MLLVYCICSTLHAHAEFGLAANAEALRSHALVEKSEVHHKSFQAQRCSLLHAATEKNIHKLLAGVREEVESVQDAADQFFLGAPDSRFSPVKKKLKTPIQMTYAIFLSIKDKYTLFRGFIWDYNFLCIKQYHTKLSHRSDCILPDDT